MNFLYLAFKTSRKESTFALEIFVTMFKQMLDQLIGGAQSATSTISQKGFLNNPMLAGAGGGLLAGLLLSNKKIRRTGGTAALGAIAFNAYRNWQAKKNQSAGITPQPQQQPSQKMALDFGALPPSKQEDHSHVMLAAMVAAAKADGHFDERERQLIHEQTEKIGDANAVAWVQQEIYKPLDVNEIAALASSPEMAAEIYLASLIVVDEQNASEKTYLNSLAEKLRLDPQLRKEIEQQLANEA
jgi:uncharacterized membrane protein YebE (DUF533 family)